MDWSAPTERAKRHFSKLSSAKKELTKAEEKLRALANKISQGRVKVIPQIEKKVKELLNEFFQRMQTRGSWGKPGAGAQRG